MDCRIDHRSFARQGVEQIPTQHEGPTVRAMEAKGIRTDKGDLNRFIRKTNALLREAKEKTAALKKSASAKQSRIKELDGLLRIGINKLREITNEDRCKFVLWMGNKRLIKRRLFDQFIEQAYSI